MRHALEGDGIDPSDRLARRRVALRFALMVRHVDDEVPMLVTIFDPTMAAQVERDLEHCEVTSMADIVAPSLAGPCLGDDLTASARTPTRRSGILESAPPDEVRSRCRTAAARRRSPGRPRALRQERRAAAVGRARARGDPLLETVACMAVLGQGVVDASYGSAKTLVTVDPNDEVADGPRPQAVPHRLDARRPRLRGLRSPPASLTG